MGRRRGERALHAMTGFAGLRSKASPRAVGLGAVLALVTASAALQLLVEGSNLARLVVVWLQALTLVAAVRSAGAKRTSVRLASAAAAAAALAALIVIVVTGEMPKAPAAVVNGLLVAVAPVVIGAGLLRRLREDQAVGVSILAGVLAIYVLAGMFFSFMYSVIGAVDPDALFAGHTTTTAADQLYFSYVTLSTVGYGDLTPLGQLPRALAVCEMLIGQIYLVTVVAMIVGHLGHGDRARAASR
jgi:Ion channel